MGTLTVPRAYRAAVQRLAEIDHGSWIELVAAIEQLPAFAPVTDIDSSAHDALGDSAPGVTAALLSVRGLFRGVSVEELANRLSSSPDLDLDDSSRALLRTRAEAVLATQVFATTAVAADLQTQHERNFQSARVFTDIRPVFNDNADEVAGAVVVETLQLQTWSRSGTEETFYVALDERDLKNLRETVERAIKKTSALRRYLDQQGLPYFQLDDE